MVITRQLTDSASASTASDIQLGSCVTEIGQGAFSGYTNITDVEFPDSLTTIGVGAFSGSSITSVEFPSSVTTIGNSAFTSCNLSELTIPSGVTSIGDRAFMHNNSLERINVSASTVPTLGGDAFDYTNNCTIYVPFDLYEDYMASQSWQEYRSRIYYNGMPFKVMFNTSNGEVSYVKCDSSTIVSAPSTMPSNITATTFGECVTDFADKAFQDKSLGNITIPSNVKYINQMGSGRSYAFYGVSATSISFSEGLEEIGYSSFAGFSCPQAITLPSTLSAMSYYAFAGSTITGLTINGSPLLELNQYAFTRSSLNFINISNIKTVNGFRSCSNLETVTISNVENINGTFDSGNLKTVSITGSGSTTINGSFYNCRSLTSVTLGDCVKSIGSFYGCSSLSSITIPSGVTIIGDNCFGYCGSLETINLPSGITSIGSSAFQYCAIKSMTLPNALETIDNNAFYGCSGLTSIDIPSGVTTLNNLFSGCTSLSSITGCENVNNIVNGAFKGASALQNFAIPSGITVINDNTFSGCTNLRNVDIPSGVTSIGVNAFTNCRSMTTLIIPNNVISIGNNAFSGCSGLNSILIGRATPPTIGTNVFAGSNCLIYVPQASYDLYVNAENWSTYRDRIYATGIDYKAMLIGGTTNIIECNGNTTLAQSEVGTNNAETINIGNCVTAIGDSAFTSSNSIQTVSIPSGVTSIGNYAFCKYRSTLKTVSGLQGVETIGDYAFQYCSGLTSISLSDNLISVGFGAFNGCNSLGGVTLPSTVTSVSNNAFNANLEYIKLTSTTPPELVLEGQYYENYCFGRSGSTAYPIYVPCTSYEAYKTAWNSYNQIKDRIVPFGDYTKQEIVSGEYICDGHVKYEKIENFVSSDEQTWCSVGYTKGNVISDGSDDCLPRITIRYSGNTCNPTTTEVLCENASSTLYPNEYDSSNIDYCDYWSATAITIGDCVTTLSADTQYFAYKPFKTITLPNTITEIPSGDAYSSVFGECSATTINIGNAVTSIGNYAFNKCRNLKRLNSNTDGVFNIPNSVTTIGGSAFASCSGLTSINIPSGVTSIGSYAFSSCSGLTSIEIPSGVTYIGSSAFSSCSGLTSITVNAVTPPTIGYYIFDNTNNCPIYVPTESVEAYKAATNWSDYTDRIQAIPNS